jgi:hypothetical protein
VANIQVPEAEQARRKAEWERVKKLEDAGIDPRKEKKGSSGSGSSKDSSRRDSRSPRDQYKRQEMLEDSKSSSRRHRLDDHSYESPAEDVYAQIPDRETRRLERRRRLDSVSGSPRQQYVSAHRRDDRSASPRQQYSAPPPVYRDPRDDYRYSPSLDYDARRRERSKRQQTSSSSARGSDRYRRSKRHPRDHSGAEGADGLPGRDDDIDGNDGAGGDGGDGGGGGGGGGE